LLGGGGEREVATQLDMLVVVVVTGTAMERLVKTAVRRKLWNCIMVVDVLSALVL